MKFVKKLTALFLAVVMVMAMGITAFAAETTYTITVNESKSGYTYVAYQVFSGTYNADTKTLGDIDWGDVDGAKILAALKADSTFNSKVTDEESGEEKDVNDFANCATAKDVAEVLANYTNDSAKLVKFADIAGANLKTLDSTTKEARTAKYNQNTEDATKSNYTISGLKPGYYLVKNEGVPAVEENEQPNSYSRFLLKLVENTSVTPKTETTEVDKKIVETTTDATGAITGTTKTDANTASIGTSVNYEIKSTVPDMTGYNKYYFIANDTLSKGLTFNDDIVIKFYNVDSNGNIETETNGQYKADAVAKTLTKDTDYTVTSTKDETTGKTAIKIVFNNMLANQQYAGKAIVITYSATLNQDADITATGNPNTVKLTYSNNPNVTPKGENEPGPDDKDVTGETPESKTVTYTTGLKLTKVDAQNTSKKLTGAKFSISGTSKQVVLINQEVYKKDNTNGTYYRLKDGTYTTEASTNETVQKYESTTDKYVKVTEVVKTTKDEDVQSEGWVKADGTIEFKGLGEGTYTITELVAPDGYNLLKDPITVVITANEAKDSVTWTVTKVNGKLDSTVQEGSGDPKDETLTASSNLYTMNVENNKGSQLPSTGGMGTTVIYAAGIALIVAAGVVVIVKKRFA